MRVARWGRGGCVEISSEETNHPSETTPLFCHCLIQPWFLGFKLSWSFSTWKREKRDPVNPVAKDTPKRATNQWTTEPTLPLADTCSGTKHRTAGPGTRVSNNAPRISYTLILAKRPRSDAVKNTVGFFLFFFVFVFVFCLFVFCMEEKYITWRESLKGSTFFKGNIWVPMSSHSNA